MQTVQIVYQDQDLVAVNKPAGLVVNRSQTHDEETLQDWIEQQDWWRTGEGWQENYPEKLRIELVDMAGESDEILGDRYDLFTQRSGLVHRLDKETSGVLLIAKHPDALIATMREFKGRRVIKTYQALCHGKVQPDHGVIDLPIGRRRGGQLQFAVTEDGKHSQTQYQVMAYYPHLDVEAVLDHKRQQSISQEEGSQLSFSGNFRKMSKIYQGFSLVELQPKTGRTHQIRVHMSAIKHPLVGDKIYSGKKRQSLDQVWSPRHFLHAVKLELNHPRDGKKLTIAGKLAEDLQQVKEFLKD